jgi:hypothetical protein
VRPRLTGGATLLDGSSLARELVRLSSGPVAGLVWPHHPQDIQQRLDAKVAKLKGTRDELFDRVLSAEAAAREEVGAGSRSSVSGAALPCAAHAMLPAHLFRFVGRPAWRSGCALPVAAPPLPQEHPLPVLACAPQEQRRWQQQVSQLQATSQAEAGKAREEAQQAFEREARLLREAGARAQAGAEAAGAALRELRCAHDLLLAQHSEAQQRSALQVRARGWARAL